ncbi:MAG: hypothetical protein AAGA03_12500 [Planctomycetota bacterium]
MVPSKHFRRASSYLEVQVAMVMLAIGTAGLLSISVIQTRQTVQLTELLDQGTSHALNPADSSWASKLGVYTTVEESVAPRSAITPHLQFQQIIDDAMGSPFRQVHTAPDDDFGWYVYGSSTTYLSSCVYTYCTGYGSYVGFHFEDVPPGRYDLFTTYRAWSILSDSVTHQVRVDGNLVNTITVNQRQAPNDLTFDSTGWRHLHTLSFDGDLEVRLVDDVAKSDYLFADAVMLRNAETLEIITVQKNAGGAQAVLREPW